MSVEIVEMNAYGDRLYKIRDDSGEFISIRQSGGKSYLWLRGGSNSIYITIEQLREAMPILQGILDSHAAGGQE